MVETKNANYSLSVDKINWVKRQKELTGKPESFFVDKGLDIVMGASKLSAMNLIIVPMVVFYAGVLIVVFDLFFFYIIPFIFSIFIVALGGFVMVVALFATAKGLKIWRLANGKHTK